MADRESRKKRITKRREEQILKAASDVFTSRGYAAATIPEIASSAGVAVGTIYNYYPSKRELFIAVILKLIITTPLLDLIDRMPEENVAATFRQIMQDRFSLIENEPISKIPSLMGEIIRDPELKRIWIEQFIQPFFTRMEKVYLRMTDSGKFRPVEPAIATRLIGGMIFGFLMLKIMEGEASPLNRMPDNKVADIVADFVGRGLMNTDILPKG